MHDEREDEAYRRLRAADPAGDLEPDVPALLAAARARAGLTPDALLHETAGAVPAGDGTAVGAASAPAVDQLAAARAAAEVRSAERAAVPRRPARRRRLSVAAVVAGLLVLGGGGYGLSVLGGAGSGWTTVESAAGSAAGPAKAQGPADALAPQAASGERFLADGLAQTGGTGTVHDLVATSASGAGYAAALGVVGTAQRTSDGLRTTDARGRTVTTRALPGLLVVGYADPAADPVRCGPRCADPPAVDDALAGVLALLRSSGVDVTVFTTWTSVEGRVVEVDLAQEVDGLASPLGWRARVSGAGVVTLDGTVAGLGAGVAHDVVSPAEAVARLDDPRYGTAWAAPMTSEDGRLPADVAAGLATGSAPASPRTTASTGAGPASTTSSVQAPAPGGTSVSVVRARLGLALDGGRLVPAYELTDSTGRTYRVPALTDQALEVLGR